MTSTAIAALRSDPGVDPTACKVLSFTDNRQDASLQAGHFGDFLRVALIRTALYRALEQHVNLDHAVLAREVFRSLGLPQKAYAKEPSPRSFAKARIEGAMQAYLEYLLYEDLRRGWRVAQPNLEQCGLLRIEYPDLGEICKETGFWSGHSLLQQVLPNVREKAVRALLEHLRRELAIDVKILDPEEQEALKRRVEQDLAENWKFDRDVELVNSCFFVLPPATPHGQEPRERSLGARSKLGRYLRSRRTWETDRDLTADEYAELIHALVEVLRGLYLTVVKAPTSRASAVQLLAGAFVWRLGNGTPPEPDPVRTRWMVSSWVEQAQKEINRFFANFYRQAAVELAEIEGEAHTAQVPAEQR